MDISRLRNQGSYHGCDVCNTCQQAPQLWESDLYGSYAIRCDCLGHLENYELGDDLDILIEDWNETQRERSQDDY